MNNAAFRVPFVNAFERNGVAQLQWPHSTCQVDVVRDEQRLTARQRENEALMATAVTVIGEQPRDHAFTVNVNATSMLIERSLDCAGRTGLLRTTGAVQ